MRKDILINLRVEKDLKEQFQEIAEDNGYTMSEVITASMKDVVRRGYIPINLCSKLPRKNRSIISIQDIKSTVENVLLKKEYKEFIQRISIFGSYATGQMTPKSDVDLLIQLTEAHKVGIFDIEDFKNSLQDQLNKPIDITIEGNLDSYFLSVVNFEKITIYEKQ